MAANPAGCDWSDSNAARDLLKAMVAAANGCDDPASLFATDALTNFELLQSRWPAEFSAILASVPYLWKAEILRLLRERAKAARNDGDAEPGEDWPGDGSVAHYLTTPAPPRAWHIRDRLPRNRAAVVAGIGGSSKTTFLWQLGVGSVIGRLPWGWTVERTGSAALLLAEDTGEDAHQKLWAIGEAMKFTADECVSIVEQLFVYPMAGRDVRLLASVGGDLVETGKVDALIEALRALPPPLAFVGLDPALAFTGGDELDQSHQRRLGELIDRIAIELDACVLLSAHAAKSLANAEEVGSHSARGGGALTDAVRAELTLRTMTAAEARGFGIDSIEERKAHVSVQATKGNALPPSAFAPLWLRRGPGGVLEAADLVRQEAPQVGPREVRALEVLRGLAAVQAVPLRAWREACVAAGLVSGSTEPARQKSMERIRDALLAAGLIERGTGRGVYVPTVAE
jgi:hypothetical protein